MRALELFGRQCAHSVGPEPGDHAQAWGSGTLVTIRPIDQYEWLEAGDLWIWSISTVMEGLQMLTSTPRLRVVSNGARLSSMLRLCSGHRSFNALLHIIQQMLSKQLAG